MAEEQDIKQETVEETEDTTNVEEPTVEKNEEAVADAAQVLEELNGYKRTLKISNVVLTRKKSNLLDM